MFKKTLLAAALTLLLVPSTASASLIGDLVDIRWAFPDFATTFASTTVLVGAGNEIVCPGSFGGANPLCAGFAVASAFDLDASSITLTHTAGSSSYTATAFNGFAFSDLDLGGAITDVNLITNMAGLDLSRVAFGADFVNINLQGFAVNPGDFFRLELAVPEPASMLLVGFGLAGVAARRRFRLNR